MAGNVTFAVDDQEVDWADHTPLGRGRAYGAGVLLAGDPYVDANLVALSVNIVLGTGGGTVLGGIVSTAARL